LPWRGNTQTRSDLESLLAGRIRDWRTLDEGQVSMVTEAQRATLPALRDGLLGMSDLPSASLRMDELSERWLVDFAATGATSLTLIEQATITLQSLINGIRNKWFESDHPAHKWHIKSEFENDFDKEWKWLGSYGTWRSAVMNYSYPENVLYPELLPSPMFKDFLAELRKLQPLTDEKLIWIKGILPAKEAPDIPFKEHVSSLWLWIGTGWFMTRACHWISAKGLLSSGMRMTNFHLRRSLMINGH
jgi:hypothetical protein